MKRFIICLTACLSLSLMFNSCSKDDNVSFDETLLYGYWKSGTVNYRYDSNGMGVTWDTSDDVTEQEGQSFNWTLNKADLTLTHYINGVPQLPKPYTVTDLTTTSLKYHDDYSSFSFTKYTPS